MINMLNTLIVKASTFGPQALATLPENGLTQFGFKLAGIAGSVPVPFGASGFDQDVKDELNPVILGFVYIMYALTLVFVILGIMKARSEDKQAAMWYLILAAIIGIAGLVVRNIFEKVADETQIDF